MPLCAVYKCGNKSGSVLNSVTRKEIHFHRFPNRDRSPERFTAWREFCKRENFIPNRNSVICSSHFKLSDCNESQLLKMKLMPGEKLRGPNLKPGVIPTINSTFVTTNHEKSVNSVCERRENTTFVNNQLDDAVPSSKLVGNTHISDSITSYEPGDNDPKHYDLESLNRINSLRDSNENILVSNECNSSTDDHTANCKEKWKNLRACLCRHLRTQVSSSWKRPYYLADYMKFVIPFTKYGRSAYEPNTTLYATSVFDYETEEMDESSMDTLSIKQEMDDDYIEICEETPLPVPVVDFGTDADPISPAAELSNGDNESSETNVVSGSNEATPRLKVKRTLQKIEPMKKVKVEYLSEKKQKLCTSSSNNSPDLEFFKSLLPDLERMDYRQKIKFKLAVLGCIDKILYPETGQENVEKNVENVEKNVDS